jgi:pimeloyl-ACP methyl ester carboxylesterase
MKRIKKIWLFVLLLPFAFGCGSEAADKMEENKKQKSTLVAADATTSKTQFAEKDGRKIAYRSIGKGDPIILCPRFRGNLDSWDPAFLDGLARNFTVITFDYSGFGSSTGEPAIDMPGFAKDIKDLADVLQYNKFILGGWSFGGGVAQVFMTEYPDRVSHTILIGTRPPGKITHSFEKIFLEISRKANNTLEDEMILFFEPAWEASREAAKLSHDRIAKRTEDTDTKIDEKVWDNYSKGFADFTEDKYKAREKLTTTTIPILVISSDHEVCFPPENWFELNRKLPTTQVIVIPRTGHGVHHEYPELVSNYITHFVQDRK